MMLQLALICLISSWLVTADPSQESFSPLSATPQVYRNVRDFGARGDGSGDDTAAIIRALTDGRADQGSNVPFGPGTTYSASTQKPAFVFFPAGVYIISDTLPVIYYTQMVGDETNGTWPTLKFVSSAPDKRILEACGSWYTGVNQDNFYRQIRNFIIDAQSCVRCTGIHWQVAQATSISNVWFKLGRGTSNQGMWMENGSGGFFNNLIFDGGLFGLWVGNQQFTSRNITIRDASVAAIYLNWNWVWTFINLRVERSPIAINVASSTGSLVVVDSTFIGCGTAIQTNFNPSSGYGNNSVIVDNVIYSAFPPDGALVRAFDDTVLPTHESGAGSVESWVQGFIWQGGTRLGSISLPQHNRPMELAPTNGAFFAKSRPDYAVSDRVDVTTLGLVGDGRTDNTAALQLAVKRFAGAQALFFPSGNYIITDTVYLPPGTRMMGQVWSTISASNINGKFSDANRPIPMLRAAAPGDRGVLQLVDLMISTQGPVPGCVLIEWNIHDPVAQPGSCGLWDVHYRIGGAVGTNIDKNNCPKGDGSSAPASICTGAHTLLHLTSQSSAYLENVWGWVADHDIDSGKASTQMNVYNARGLRCESAGPVWLYGTAFEHSSLYQYSFVDSRNIFMGAIQTETAYYQPAPLTPFAPEPIFNDPIFCKDDARCAMSFAVWMRNSTNIFVYGTGLYSFFNTWDQTCLQSSPPRCQRDLVDIDASADVYLFGFNTYGSEYMRTQKVAWSHASMNPSTFCASCIVDLDLF